MLSLLRGEYYQLRKSLPIKIMFLFSMAASFFLGLNLLNDGKLVGDDAYLQYGNGMVYSGMLDGVNGLFAALSASWLITAAYENRTIQEAISYGKSRTMIYLAKLLVYFPVCVAMCLGYWFCSSILMYGKNGAGTAETLGNLSDPGYFTGMLLAGVLAYMSLFAICSLVGFLCRKTSVSMAIGIICVVLGGNLLMSILPHPISDYVEYTPVGLYFQVVKMDVQWDDIYQTILYSILWIAGICGIGLWRFHRMELK